MEIGGAGLSPASLLPSANARASARVSADLLGWAELMWDLVHVAAMGIEDQLKKSKFLGRLPLHCLPFDFL